MRQTKNGNQTNIIVKYDLKNKKILLEKTLDRAYINNDQISRSNEQNNSIRLITQNGKIYAIYERTSDGHITVSTIDKTTLSIIKNWINPEKHKLSEFGACFMMDHNFYFLNKTNAKIILVLI